MMRHETMHRPVEIGAGLILEGGLIPSDMIAKIARGQAAEQAATDYGVPKGLTLNDEIERAFRMACAANDEPSADATAQVRAVLRAFGFDDLKTGPLMAGDRHFPVDLLTGDGRVPVVIAPEGGLDRARHEGGPAGRFRSPALLLQDALNASDDALWGLVIDGKRIRLMRDSVRLGRPAFLEADLGAIVDTDDLGAFAGLWRLIHRTRFGRGEAGEGPLERWSKVAAEQGVAARDRLRDGVEAALRALGAGALADPATRARIEAEENPAEALHAEALRVVYRLIFVLTTEDRNLLHTPDATDEARETYAEGYALSRLALRARRRASRDRHHDAWEGVKVLFRALQKGEPLLGLPALGGLFREGLTPILDTATLPNPHFLDALFHLAWIRDGYALARINWRDMQTEELGSVYESLLELVPRLAENHTLLDYAGGAETRGNQRKTTGSYYTPDSLVQTLLDSALDPVIADRRRGIGTPNGETGADGILTMTVCDPACGSGHFLLAAARRIADAVARTRAEAEGETFDPPAFRHALREVVARCIFGVDRNDFAVELARVALWIESVEPGRPLGFLDANIRHGDALLGLSDLTMLTEGIPDAAYKALTGDDKGIASDLRKRNKAEREGQGDLGLDGPGGLPPALVAFDERLHAASQDTLEEVERLRASFEARGADAERRRVRRAADAWVAAFLLPKKPNVQVPTTADIGRILTREGDPVLVQGVADTAAEAHVLHWPIAFPAIWARGGFDVLLGNPPWERIKLQEQEFFASRAPDIAEAPNAAARGRMIKALAEAEPGTPEQQLHAAFWHAKRTAEAASEFARAEGGRYPLTGRGDVNTYALFAEHFARSVNRHGRAGVIVPTGIATDATTAPFFGWLVEERRLARLVDFENSAPIFPGVHRSFKFALLTLGHDEDEARFAFFLTDPLQLAHRERSFVLTPEQIARINPNTKTAPVFRSRHDAELTAKIYDAAPVLIEEGRTDGNPWSFDYATKLFDMSDDSGLFCSSSQLEDEGWRRDGTYWTRPRTHAPRPAAARPAQAAMDLDGSDTRSLPLAQAEDRMVPLYEAKMIHQLDHRWATYDGESARDATPLEKADPGWEPMPRYWVTEMEVERRLKAKGWPRRWLMGWRDIARSTDERTLIASLVPRTAVGHTLRLMAVASKSGEVCGFLGSSQALVLDYVARQKIGGTHFTVDNWRQLPIFAPTFYTPERLAFVTPRVLELTYTSRALAPFARDLGHDGPPFAWDEERRALLRAELDAFYARAYGLTRDELRYILDPASVMGADYPSETFRVLKQKEERLYGEYRTERLVLEAWDRLSADWSAVGLGEDV
ncbi:Eco57I restriction-modification methylase domain-containing protein [Pseudooceanicola aestuarii]|uniref:Eco57I restriction-modification methylase domain-containing protein n=1 Tax=Pseudooceanicola aestuarii TaxID=2697319 RepID=UPI001EF817E6|nr:DNA methyltransferase [Pseudooceanicola aestuarii]